MIAKTIDKVRKYGLTAYDVGEMILNSSLEEIIDVHTNQHSG
jgi:hypothetical protein